jgi:hypothetical protein
MPGFITEFYIGDTVCSKTDIEASDYLTASGNLKLYAVSQILAYQSAWSTDDVGNRQPVISYKYFLVGNYREFWLDEQYVLTQRQAREMIRQKAYEL